MNNDLLTTLIQRLDAPAERYATLDRYYRGTQPLAFLSPEASEAVKKRLTRMSTNLPHLAVTALAERLRVTGLTRDGAADEALWGHWLRNDLDQLAGVAHREALALGRSFVIVWADPDGRPRVTVESARNVSVLRDPVTRRIVAAVKRWRTPVSTEAVLYEQDRITRLRSDTVGASAGFETVAVLDNPLGVAPVVSLINDDRLAVETEDDLEGVSEIEDLIPLVDALNKVLSDMAVTSEYTALPRRWATGLQLAETTGEDGRTDVVNPLSDTVRMMVSEDPQTSFGQLPAAGVGAFSEAVKVLLGQIMAVSALPAHYIGALTDAPPSADSLRAAEASLTARAEARQQAFGRSWEDVARLMVAVGEGVDPTGVDVHVRWADAATRSTAQEADAVVKLYQAGLLPRTFALARLGYSADDIDAIRAAIRTEALDTAASQLPGLMAS